MRTAGHEGLSDDEQAEWTQVMRVEHLIRLAKAKAAIKLGPAASQA